ncbi:hypothetical protein EPN29_01470 [bacterium]|nr:MAG: hypothetical protein EPN29_01470 [bacterium]
MASAAFKAWRAAAGARERASRFDLEIPVHVDSSFDFAARAHELGIHVSPNSTWPFVICLGLLFLGLGAVPFGSVVRIVLAVMGGLIFLWGVVGWVVVEDVRIFPSDKPQAPGEVHH